MTTRQALVSAAVAVILNLASVAVGATDYYVSPAGNDNDAGTSQLSPWKTLAKVNGKAFAAGDRILLEGGQTFAGGLSFDAGDTGTVASPITVSSYGTGRATVSSSASQDGLSAYNTSGFNVMNLIFVGSGAATSTKSGISFYMDLAGNVRLPYVHIDNVDVSGYRNGISVGSWNGSSGFDDVRVTQCAAHANQRSGMSTYAQARYGITNVYVGHCRFFDNLGDPALTTNSGSGIVLGEVDHGTIEYSLAYNNGGSCTASAGPVGIWAYDSNDITIQHNEAYDNHTGGPADGGGFDLDGGVTNSVVQYNYSHGNDGAGIGLYQYAGASTWNGNVVRYNVSENDGRKNGYGAITVWNGGSGISNAEIYNNTLYVSPSSTGTPRAIKFDTASTNLHFRNNLIVTSGGVRLLDVPAGQSGLLFQGNDYWSSGAAFGIGWNGTTYSSLAAWIAATGQEKVGATTVGRNVDPQLASAGGGGTVGNADALGTLTAYTLAPGSPMINAGLDLLTAFGISPGAADFYGTSIPQGAGFDVGAHEFAASGGTNTAPSVTATSANPNPTGATTTNVLASATDDGLESALTYTWSVVSAPAAGGATFSPNATNASKNSSAIFTRAGSYMLRVTARDAGGLTATMDMGVTVNATLTSIVVSPSNATVARSGTQQFSATARDQFGVALDVQPAFAWTITGAGNTITAAGLARAGTATGNFAVTAASGGKSGVATLSVAKKIH